MKYINALLVLVLCVAMAACDDEMKFMAEGDPMQISVNATTKYSGAQSRAILGDEVEITGYTFLYYVKKDGNLTLSNKTYSATVPFNVVLECPGTESNLAILIANAPEDAFDNLALGSKLSDLNDITYDVTHYDNDPSSAEEFTWSGFCEVKQDTRKISFTLNPNVAKITVKIIDNSSESQVVNLRMKRVRNKVRYAQNALYRSGHSNEATVAQINRGYVNYDMEDMNLSKVGDNTYSWYVPHNEPIHVSGQTYSREAGLVPSGSTFLEIDGLRLTDYQCTSYRIYPGVSEKDGEGNIKEYNYLSNYNIIADYQYSIEVTINDDGIAYSGDSDLNWYYPDNYNTSLKVKLPGKSNSYMIHPKAQS